MATMSPVATPSWRSPRARHNTSSANCLPVFCRLPVIVTTSSLRRVERRVRHWQMWGSEYENLLLILCFFLGFLNSLRKLESAVLYINKQYLIYRDKIRLRVGDDSPQLNPIGYCDCKSLSLVWLTTFVKLVFIFFFLFLFLIGKLV